eukprot:TRINITY_DN7260_c0_g1_i1.p2 TRINITY_DN7260_c0_g1~~TRINITY_DN7260_c0_g1_i1.p2  ORF type:complete len:296 (+),score=117.59 TRINITY_DN7260_c0_g1_i1:144-1031(+)
MSEHAEDHPSLAQVNLLRLTRSHVVKLQCRFFPHVLSDIIQGCFVRVLLEASGQGKEQKYWVARIRGTKSGEEYDGYSFGQESTSTYLVLDVPECEGPTDQIMLNSISNSDFTEDEYSEWQKAMTPAERLVKIPRPPELEKMWLHLRPHLIDASIDVDKMRAETVFSHLRRQATMVARDAQKKRKLPENGGGEFQEMQVLELQRELDSRMEFPKQLGNLNMHELHRLEEQVAAYMAELRQRKKDLSQCKICMEKDVEVVLLPCKHQVMCQTCSYQVDDCPICRVRIEDRILPHKF